MASFSEGLDLSNIDQTSPEEIQAALAGVWGWRGPLYEMYALSLALDFEPDVAKLSRWGSDLFGRPSGPSNTLLQSCLNIHTYMMLGWETGIRNEFYTLWRLGLSKDQLMELVMFSQLYCGVRGLGLVYHAVGDFLPIWQDPPRAPDWPDNWPVDADALKCGLDLTTRDLTADDRRNLTEWYERTIGYVPRSIVFGIRYNPKFVKLMRARWERCLKTVPTLMAPYLMLRHHTITGSVDGLRESALIGKAYGMTAQQVVRVITNIARFFTHLEGLYSAFDAVDDILQEWDPEGAVMG